LASESSYRSLTQAEIQRLAAAGCTAEDWSAVRVTDPFDPARVRGAHFAGSVRIGALGGSVVGATGLEKPDGIYHAYLADCDLGDHVRIANVGAHVARYNIGDGASIEDVGTLETNPGATFGNGAEIEPLNEGGGREVILFNELSSQFAHLLCLHRYRPRFIERLQAIARAECAKVRGDRGTIGAGARVSGVGEIIDVAIGQHALVRGAASLVNGTILSGAEAPTTVGADVQAEKFIIAEGSQVTGGAIVAKSYVGQGCQIGKQFSAEGSLFFANCEGFHGEACSVFAGPYTVTHHKSTLLIAGLFSFYNAGSGTNQSNHLYKLGPVHEGKLERGCKTGSFSYMMWPCRVGPFSVVLGKHTRTFDTSPFPFSYLEATPEGKCVMTPGFNFTTVGTVRDGAKWPNRDRRRGPVRRDRISFDVFSPLTVGRMIEGSEIMKRVGDATDRSVDTVNINGAEVKRVLLRTGQKFYRSAITMYLLDKIVARIEAGQAAGRTPAEALAASPDAVFSESWVDIGGLMMPLARLDALCGAVESGEIGDLRAFNVALDEIQAGYAEDEWTWVRWAYRKVFEADLDTATAGDLANLADELVKVRGKFINLVLNDASKEFDTVIRTGFGQDGRPDDLATDFEAVRGRYETNKFVRQLQDDLAALAARVERFKQSLLVA
jgi:hypothetical protein